MVVNFKDNLFDIVNIILFNRPQYARNSLISIKEALEKERISNQAETGYYETNQERSDREYQEERNKIAAEWMAEQEKIKKEKLEVTFSYWDGSGHRRTTILEKGVTIGKFLEKVKSELRGEFRDLQNANADDLMYIKEDLIIPHDFSFYDLIITKARGKSGPLFHFDVHDDIRMINDATVEKDEN